MTNDLRGGVLKRSVALKPNIGLHKVINDVKNFYTLALVVYRRGERITSTRVLKRIFRSSSQKLLIAGESKGTPIHSNTFIYIYLDLLHGA